MSPSRKPKTRKRAACYARVSTARQFERDLSIPDQLRQLREYCELNNIELVDEFVEAGISGRDDCRPEFQRMLANAYSDTRPYDFVLVHSFSRFARDSVVLQGRYRELMAHGVRLMAITQRADDTPEGAVMRSIFGAFDEYQSAQNSKHTHRAMCQCARDGYWPGAVAPDGYRKVPAVKIGDKTRYILKPDPERAPLIQRIFDLALTGAGEGPMGVKAIAKWLNEHGYRTRKGSRWGMSGVHGMLTSTTYIGEHYFNRQTPNRKGFRPREEWIPVPLDPIISRDDFDAVNRNLKARAPKIAAPRMMSSTMLLTGLIYCGGCGSAMTQMTGKSGRYVYYYCANKRRTGAACCAGPSIRQETVESAVCEVIANRVLAPIHIQSLVDACIEHARARSDVEVRMRAAQKALLEAESGLKRLYDGIASGVLNPTEPLLKEQIDGLALRKSEASIEAERCKSLKQAAFSPPSAEKIEQFAEGLKAKILDGSLALRKAYIRAFVDRIIFQDGQITISGRKDLLASAAAKGDLKPAGGVLTFVPEWCARQDSNLRPSA